MSDNGATVAARSGRDGAHRRLPNVAHSGRRAHPVTVGDRGRGRPLAGDRFTAGEGPGRGGAEGGSASAGRVAGTASRHRAVARFFPVRDGLRSATAGRGRR